MSISWNADITTREIYTNVLSDEISDDIITGIPYLYPVIVYNNYVNDSGCTFWDAYNFKPTSESLTGNVIYTLYGENNNAKQFGSETHTFTIGESTHSYCWIDTDYMLSTDYVIINIESDIFVDHLNYNNNVSVRFPVTATVVGCRNQCVGEDYYEATELEGGACVYDIEYSSSFCIEEIPDYVEVPEDYSGITDAWDNVTTQAGSIIGQAIDDTSDNLPTDFKYIVAILISLVAGAFLGLKTQHWAYGVISALAIFFVFMVIGFVDWWFLLIITIVSFLLIAKYGAEQLTGSGK